MQSVMTGHFLVFVATQSLKLASEPHLIVLTSLPATVRARQGPQKECADHGVMDTKLTKMAGGTRGVLCCTSTNLDAPEDVTGPAQDF